jgi:hypothetical protein
MLLCMLWPAGFGGLGRRFPPVLWGHRFQSPFPADPPPFAAHGSHDAGYLRRENRIASFGVNEKVASPVVRAAFDRHECKGHPRC